LFKKMWFSEVREGLHQRKWKAAGCP
jgi:hypothetical protein